MASISSEVAKRTKIWSLVQSKIERLGGAVTIHKLVEVTEVVETVETAVMVEVVWRRVKASVSLRS